MFDHEHRVARLNEGLERCEQALYVLGVQADALPAAVTGAMFPAVSVALGRIVFGDVVRPAQLLGLGFVLVGVAGVVGG